MATGDTLIAWDAAAAFFDPAKTAAAPVVSADGVPALAFDDATDEYALFHGVMPGQYDGTTALTVVVGWKFTDTSSSRTVEWEVSICRVEDDAQSVESLTFAAAQTGTPTEAGTDELDYAEIDFTNAQFDGVQPSDAFVLQVMRDSSEETASPGDAEVYFVEVQLQ